MNTALAEWKDAASRAKDVRDKVVSLVASNQPAPPALLAKLAELQSDAHKKLRAIHAAGLRSRS